MTAPYICAGCERDVDPDLEPSPGEPQWCPDCLNDRRRELDERMWDALRDGWSGVA